MPVQCPSLLTARVAVQPKAFIVRGLRFVFDVALISRLTSASFFQRIGIPGLPLLVSRLHDNG
jgi:hypothetical protein